MQGRAIFDRISGLLLIALGIFAIWHALSLKVAFSADPVGPRPFPVIVGGILVVCGAFIALRPENITWERGKVGWVSAVVVACLVYPFLLHPLGFVPATTFMLWVLACSVGGRLWPSLISSALLSGAILLIIDYGLGLGLPRGPIGI